MAAVRIEAGHDEHHERIAAVVARHEHVLLKIARQHSLCDDDAFDAYQRALEIFIRRVSTVNAATEVAWLKVVTRSEAGTILGFGDLTSLERHRDCSLKAKGALVRDELVRVARGDRVLHVSGCSTDRPAGSRFGSVGHHVLRFGHKRGRSRQ